MKLTVVLDREDDGRWIAEVAELAGVMCYGAVRDEAIGRAERLAIEVIADRTAHGRVISGAEAGVLYIEPKRASPVGPQS